MSKVQDFFGVVPKTVLNKPFMHVQDQKPSGTHGGTNDTGWENRELNTVVTNDISGASLGSDEITLPAGTYQIAARSIVYQTGHTKIVIVKSAGGDLLVGDSLFADGAYHINGTLEVSGQIVLTESTAIVLKLYTDDVNSLSGLGLAASAGVNELYTDLKIWQLDADIKTPVLVNDKLYPLPGNTMVTGNMHGLEYAKTNNNEVTVQAGICMDSTNTEILELATFQTVSIPTTINEVYNLFLCDDGVVRVDTDVDGATLAATNDAFRWIGFVLNSGSGSVVNCHLKCNVLYFKVGLGIVSGLIHLAITPVDLSPFCPASRVAASRIMLRVYGAQSEGRIFTKDQTKAIGYCSSFGTSSTYTNSIAIDVPGYEAKVEMIYSETDEAYVTAFTLYR